MSRIAEIALNPARPVKAITDAIKAGLSDSQVAERINAAILESGRKFSKSFPALTAKNVAYYRKIHFPASRTVQYNTKSGEKKTRTLSPEKILELRAKAAQRRSAQRNAPMSDLASVYAKMAGGGKRTSITSAQRAKYQAERDLLAQMKELMSKLNMKTDRLITRGSKKGQRAPIYGSRLAKLDDYLALQTIGAQVGAMARPRKKSRNVGTMVAMNPTLVAMNPTFGNPSFEFSKEAIFSNVISGTQTSLGVVAGVAAAKYGNDLVVEKIMQSVFKKAPADKQTIWQRLATAAFTGVVAPGLVRSFLPNKPWVDKVADGMVAGSALYVLGGVEIGGKPVFNVGEMVGTQVGAKDLVIDTKVNAPVSAPVVAAEERYQIDNSVQAYDQNEDSNYVGSNDSMMDNMVGGDYDLTENPDLR